MAKKNLKTLYPRAFKLIKMDKPKSKYTEEEKTKLFVEGHCRVPGPTKNKKKFQKKAERQKRWKEE